MSIPGYDHWKLRSDRDEFPDDGRSDDAPIAEELDALCTRLAHDYVERACGHALGPLPGDCPPDLQFRFEKIERELAQALQLLVEGNLPCG